MSATHEGPLGTAVHLGIDSRLAGADCTVTWWLLTGDWHPVWSQFVLSVVHLRDCPGREAAQLQFPGATHELVVMALHPAELPARHSPLTLTNGGVRAVGGWLEPIDVVHQFTATDDEMTELAELCARASVDGVLNPSTDDNRVHYREQWLSACVKTLAHMRGEEHAP